MAILGIRRGIECSNGRLRQVLPADGEKPAEYKNIEVFEKTTRSTNSAYPSEKKNTARDLGMSNPTQGDAAYMSYDSSLLSLSYNLKFQSILDIEMNDTKEAQFVERLKKVFFGDEKTEVLSDVEIAKHLIGRAYANRIISANAGWRNANNSVSTKTSVQVSIDGGEFVPYEFKHVNFMYHDVFDLEAMIVREPVANKEEFYELGALITKALFDNIDPIVVCMKVEHIYDFGVPGMEIFPSQLMNSDEKKAANKKKFLFSIDGTAALSSQKIQNAIRRYDAFNGVKHLPVEPLGADISDGYAYRSSLKYNPDKKDNSFYAYKEEFEANPEFEQSLNVGDFVYILGCIVRGGVYGGSAEEAKAKKAKTDEAAKAAKPKKAVKGSSKKGSTKKEGEPENEDFNLDGELPNNVVEVENV